METYTCEICGRDVEIETVEALMGHLEHYEHGQCIECFEKSVEEDN